MLFLKLSTNELIVLLCTIPMFLIIFVIALIALIKRIKMAKLYKKEKSNDNNELQETLLGALGGKENIISVNVEMSRLTITLKNLVYKTCKIGVAPIAIPGCPDLALSIISLHKTLILFIHN